jgi:hypothetical protein
MSKLQLGVIYGSRSSEHEVVAHQRLQLIRPSIRRIRLNPVYIT